MAKANKGTAKVKKMNTDFAQILGVLTDVAESTDEIMPLFSASIKLSIRILKEYIKAFNAGTKYVKPK